MPLGYLKRITKMVGRGNALQEWREHLLNASTADFLLNEDHSVHLLQSAIANIEEGTDSLTAFARLATHFAAPVQERDLLRCLRATIQILVIHSITYGDFHWMGTPAIKEVERLSIRLRALLFKPSPPARPLEDGKVSMDNCIHLASLLDRAAAMNSLRGAIIRQLYTLANLIPSALPFRHYNPANTFHIKNAANLLARLHPDVHCMAGMAFSLVMNPIPFSARIEISPPEYETEKEAECCLVDI